MAPFGRLRTNSYSSSIVTVAVSCTVFEIERDIGRETPILIPPLPFYLRNNLEPLDFFLKILLRTVKLPELVDGAKVLLKISTV